MNVKELLMLGARSGAFIPLPQCLRWKQNLRGEKEAKVVCTYRASSRLDWETLTEEKKKKDFKIEMQQQLKK